MNDMLQSKKEVYRGAAKLPGRPKAAFFSILALVFICVILFNLVASIPYSAFIKIGILILAAVGINYILKQGTFSVTYVLTEDSILVYITKYGLLEWESAWIDLADAEIKGNKIIYKKRKYDFYPDDKLRELVKK